MPRQDETYKRAIREKTVTGTEESHESKASRRAGMQVGVLSRRVERQETE